MVVKSYSDLLKEIEVYQILVNQLESEHAKLFKLIYTPPKGYVTATIDGMPKGSSNHASMDRVLEQMKIVEQELNVYRDILTDKRHAKREIDTYIEGLEGIEHKVAYGRFVEGKTLIEIADETNMSLSWIEKVSAELKRKSL